MDGIIIVEAYFEEGTNQHPHKLDCTDTDMHARIHSLDYCGIFAFFLEEAKAYSHPPTRSFFA